MKATRISFSLIILQFFLIEVVSEAQYGYSSFVDSLIIQVTDSSLSLADRQISGDTTIIYNGATDSIMSRHIYEPGNPKAAQYIKQQFLSFGLSAYIQSYGTYGQNVIATLTGTEYPDQYYILCAHYDDRPDSCIAPGADDNGTGVSTVLEAARILSQYSFPYTIKFITFDEEEIGMYGSMNYATYAYNNNHQILGVLNVDMIGWDGNNDFECGVSSNAASMSLSGSYIDLMKMYQPQLEPKTIALNASDHYRFWERGYRALLSVEDYGNDENPYYHTVYDNFSYINHPYFLSIARAAIATVTTWALGYDIELEHQPLSNGISIGERSAQLVIEGGTSPDTGANSPRMYYKVDDEDFNFVLPSGSNGDTFSFTLPEFLLGSKISYYFAVQDTSGEYVVTLPKYGKGTNPPGGTCPDQYFKFYVLEDTTITFSASGLPGAIPANDTLVKDIYISPGGRILDVNALVSLNHTSCRDLDLYLVSPSGRQIELSTGNGYMLDNYVNTYFDDEATGMINQALPPFTGSFRPEHPLSCLQDSTCHGSWKLKIINRGAIAGSLEAFSLDLTFSGTCHYVDAARPVSGDGKTWATALVSIEEATALNPLPGSIVFIKPGVYHENLVITTSGEQLVPLSTGIALGDSNLVQFPAGTDLSGIDLDIFPELYFVYIFRSRNFNNGCYQVVEVNDDLDYVRVADGQFIPETGAEGDSLSLSATIGLPVIYRKYSVDPENERVILDSLNGQGQDPAIYIGDPIDDGAYDALPANFNILDGIDISGRTGGIGLQIQSSSFNTIINGRIYDSDSITVYISGNSERPALYNIISNNDIFSSPSNGICVGSQLLPENYNQAHFTHILKNNIHAADTGATMIMKNALHIGYHNQGTVVSKNNIHDIDIQLPDNAAIEIHSYADNTWVNGNTIKDIGKDNDGTNAFIMVHGLSNGIEISNNLIYDTNPVDNDVYAIRVDGSGHQGSRIVHNTIYNLDRGFLLEDYSGVMDFGVFNNILKVNDVYFTNLGNQGNFNLSHNLYFDDPTPDPGMPYSDEPGRQIGMVDFTDPETGDFRLKLSCDKSICNGLNITPPVGTDISGTCRTMLHPDIGAFELDNKRIWTGVTDQDWSNSQNWLDDQVPDPASNGIILPSVFEPVIDADVYIKGILVKPGSALHITDHQLNIIPQ